MQNDSQNFEMEMGFSKFLPTSISKFFLNNEPMNLDLAL